VAHSIDRSFLEETMLGMMFELKELVRNLGGESIFEGTTYTKPRFERSLALSYRDQLLEDFVTFLHHSKGLGS